MFKSSSSTDFFKYFFPVIMLAGAVFGIYTSWTQGTPESQGFAKAMTVAVLWISIFLVQMPLRLKYIEADEEGIRIKDRGGITRVNYKEIDWITRYDLSNPYFVTIKYLDKNSGEHKKVSFKPVQSSQKPFSNDAMSEFIKKKIISDNPNYSPEDQPSQVKNFILMILMGTPAAVLMYLFMHGVI